MASPARADLRLSEIASAGFVTQDIRAVEQLDNGGDGAHRLAVFSLNSIAVLQWSPSRGTYARSFFIQLPYDCAAMVLSDIDGDGRNDLVVFEYSFYARAAVAYDSMTGAFLRSINLPVGTDTFSPIVARDIDGRPGEEILATEFGAGVVALKGEKLLWRASGAARVIPASRRAGLSGEVFLATSSEVLVLDAQSGSERRRFPFRCWGGAAGQSVLGGAPSLACFNAGLIELHDSRTGNIIWRSDSIPPGYGALGMLMFDGDGDGRDDVFIRNDTERMDQSLLAVSGADGRFFAAPLGLHNSGTMTGITGGCEPPQIVVTDGGNGSIRNRLLLVDAATLAAKPVMVTDTKGITGIAVGDFSGRGANELAVEHDGVVDMLSLEPNDIDFSLPVGGGAVTSFRGVAPIQLDSDPQSELVTSENCGGFTGCIKAFNPPKSEPLWQALIDDEEMPRCTVVTDVDGDGAPDVLTVSRDIGSGGKGEFVYAFRGRDGKQLWRSVNVPGSIGRVVVADVEGSGTPQVLLLSGVGIVRFNRANGSVRGFDEFPGGSAFAAYTVPGDARAKEVVVAGDRLFILDGGVVTKEIRSSDLNFTTEMLVADIDGDGTPEVLLAQHDGGGFTPAGVYIRLQVRSLETLEQLWMSPNYPARINFGQTEEIAVADLDRDGRPEVALLSSMVVRIFRAESLHASSTLPRFAPPAALTADVKVHACCTTVELRWDHAVPGGAPPLRYRIYRANANGDAERLLGTTSNNEFVDHPPAPGDAYGYSIAVIDAAGDEAPERLHATTRGAVCGRTGRR